MGRTLVIGVGSSILSDDAIGLVLARRLRRMLAGREDVEFVENEEGGFTLLEEALGFDRLVVIDAARFGGEVGTLRKLTLEDLGPAMHAGFPHRMDLATVMEFGRKQSLPVPADVTVYAVQIGDAASFGESLTPRLERRVDALACEILSDVFSD